MYFCYPEVKGMRLEDIREIFNHGFGVKYVQQLQVEAKRRARMEMLEQGSDSNDKV
jgi:SP family myo-inositol transporter-like MFS transporter 13